MEIFWRTIAYYNSATWLLQIIVILIGIVLTALLISKPRPWGEDGNEDLYDRSLFVDFHCLLLYLLRRTQL